MGYDPDLYDLHSHIDRSLTLQENMRIISDDISYITPNRKVKRVISGGRIGNVDRFEQATIIFNSFNKRRQMADVRKRARNTFDVEDLNKKNFMKWKKRPFQFDIMGIDSKV